MSRQRSVPRLVAPNLHECVACSLWQLLVIIVLGVLAGCITAARGSTPQVSPDARDSPVPATASPHGADFPSVGTISAAVASPPSDSSQPHRVFLWTISSSTATVQLLGSVHMASRDVYPLAPRIESAFDSAETVVLEIPMDQASQLQAAQKLALAGTYSPGDSIDKHLNGEILALLQEHLSRSGASLDTVRAFRPWLVAVMMTLGEMQRQGYRPDLGLDIYFAEKVKGRKRIAALETVDEQVALFAGMTGPLQEEMLKETLTVLGGLGEDMKRALLLWRTGDAEGMDKLLVAPLRKDYPNLYQTLFVERNRRMAAEIEGYLRSTGRYFVVVGAGHLVGPDGILELLRGKGYTVHQE
ncbi:MAG TPA: TraB/GumN family protein [archaeon]|nr:TraB/GumN family protein [archaeon]